MTIEKLQKQLAATQAELLEASSVAENNFLAVQEINLWFIQNNLLEIKHEGDGEAAGKNVVDALNRLKDQLAASQLHIERLTGVLKVSQFDGDGVCPLCRHKHKHSGCGIEHVLSQTPSLDALNEERALVAEALAKTVREYCAEKHNGVYYEILPVVIAEQIEAVAAAYRAKKVR